MTPRDKHDNCARKKHYHHPGTRCKDAIPRVIIYFQVLIISIKDVSSTILHDHRLMAKGYDSTYRTGIITRQEDNYNPREMHLRFLPIGGNGVLYKSSLISEDMKNDSHKAPIPPHGRSVSYFVY